MFAVVQVDSRGAEALEPLGTKRKFWYRDGTKRMLFKAEERGTGEDWSEKIACELAGMLGLPRVHYELAIESDSEKPGVVCESCATAYTGLALGNQLLLQRDPAYPAGEGNRYHVKQYTVDAVSNVISSLQPVPTPWSADLPLGARSALDIFIGYVLLDAWIANQDRHHENWGALRQGTVLSLAPSFDHGASLARNLTDKERSERLTSKDSRRQVPFFARRAISAFYRHPGAAKPLSTVGAWQAFANKAPAARMIWLESMQKIGQERMQAVIDEIPAHRMTSTGREFTLQLLLENQKRILSGDKE